MTESQRILTLHQLRTLAFGAGCSVQCAHDLIARNVRSVLVVTSPPVRLLGEPIYALLRDHGVQVTIWDEIRQEPTLREFLTALSTARDANADAIVGLGGGSAMDVAKLVAALMSGEQVINDVFGIGKLKGRGTWLACLPTTSGTGSEASPIAILLDESDQQKKGVISPHLVPDAAYVDPLLTCSVPPAVTAATGIDALTHCIEAYANRQSHPMVDIFAREGIRLIADNLPRAVQEGSDLKARTALSLGSLYGGLCLGPVNTAAVHALAYPLGGEFHIAHGVTNAILLPHVLEFNLTAAPERYADIAVALGVERQPDALATAKLGVERIRELVQRCGIPSRLSDYGIGEEAIEGMVRSAMNVTRLLVQNVRPVTERDAWDIYRKAL
ncbi:MAG TPA: iron-containing alcohol dehydrogenase [Steroidobacteraceae bacterium]